MEQHFTIEGDEAFELASELAALRGTSLQAAVTDAVRDRLSKERELKAKVARVMAIVADIRVHLGSPLPTLEIDDLYDQETGLPL